ncbi:hypothetical protein C8F04DRAFT_1345250 [Mycena alexandri]|uniref:Uncharacterized protein n=1 Tax=Mycena alexandri TaxID=1745969 RepID=A0AAD6WL60_9AGAR|nr:hypothetical protein C8F04DRAFT_1345250 [Mycena alexandri]
MADASTHSQMLSLSVSGLARAAGWGCDSDNDNEAEAEEMESGLHCTPVRAQAASSQLVVLDGQLDKWQLGLPAHLQHNPAMRSAAGAVVPLPQVLTLHMQYWCAVLLLHRPFIRQNGGKRHKHSPTPKEGHVWGSAEKSYELCVGVANHITTIAMLYSETYTLKHYAVFLCYCIFTASIMHVTSRGSSSYSSSSHIRPTRMGLTKCMDALKEMEIVWPSAARALDLLCGTQTTSSETESDVSSPASNSSSIIVRSARPLSIDAPCLRTRSSASLFVYIPSKFTSLYGCPILLPSPLRSRFRRALLNQDPTAMLHPYPRPLVSPSPSSSFYAPFLPLPSRSVLAFPVAYPPARCRHLIHILSRAAHRAACHATAFVQVHKSRSKAALQRRDATRTTLWRASCNVLQCTYMVRGVDATMVRHCSPFHTISVPVSLPPPLPLYLSLVPRPSPSHS